MSATGTRRKEPSFLSAADWQGRGVTIPGVIAELDAQRKLHTAGEKAHGQARTVNLVVIATPELEQQVARGLAALRELSPSRTIVLTTDRGAELDAWLQIVCGMTDDPGRPALCHDRVILHAPAAAMEHASSLVDQLLVPDLPLFLWLPGDRPVTAANGLLGRADMVVIDARDLAPAGAVERGLAALRENSATFDLEWGRLAYWRRRIAAAFEAPQARPVAARCEEIEIVWRGTTQIGPLLIAAWAGARLGWSPQVLNRRLTLDHEGSKPAQGRLEEVAFRSRDDQVVLQRLPGGVDRHKDIFSVALRGHPDYTNGYAEALTLLEGLLEDWPGG